jgi:membrane protein implicated in regulation of membrane protease activity
MFGSLTERQLIAFAIFLALVATIVYLWRRARRRREPNPHLRIDLLGGDRGEPRD